MKKINLNIKVDDLKLDEQSSKIKPYELAKQYIEIAFNLHQQETRGMKMQDQRKIYKILDVFEKSEDIVELEDEWFDFIYKIFNEVNWIGGTKIIVRIADKLDEAKLENFK